MFYLINTYLFVIRFLHSKNYSVYLRFQGPYSSTGNSKIPLHRTCNHGSGIGEYRIIAADKDLCKYIQVDVLG
jgi:hypothetical protein